jgi:predicted RNase H-related nuclease YkuK (DUF458 family)
MLNNWRTLDGKPLPEITDAVESALIKEMSEGNEISICIGTDSQMHSTNAEFATVIVFLRKKRGGFIYVCKEVIQKYKGSLKQRMLDEVSRSIGIAYQLCGLLDRYGVEMEVHADINTDPHFESNVALKEAMGYILGMGFQFKAKPEAFASSNCANKIVQ